MELLSQEGGTMGEEGRVMGLAGKSQVKETQVKGNELASQVQPVLVRSALNLPMDRALM